MKKVLALFLVSILMLTACSSGYSNGKELPGQTGKDTNEVTVWAWDPNFNIKAMNLAKEAYESENRRC